MARPRDPERLDRILDAARDVFLAVGYRRARMADVARAAGVSPGLLYTYATGKDALFHLVVQRELRMPIDSSTPAGTPDAAALEEFGRRALHEVATIPTIERAAAGEIPDDPRAEIAAIVGEMYDGVHRYRVFIRLMERSARDRPDLAVRFYDEGRTPIVDTVARHLERRAAEGAIAPLPDAHVAARYLVETVAWFANHRYADHDGAQIDDDVARATVIELTTRALVGP